MIEKPQPIILSRISAEQLQEYKEKVNKVVYLCDGTACNRNCKELGFGRCRRTGEEAHAINKGKYNGFERVLRRSGVIDSCLLTAGKRASAAYYGLSQTIHEVCLS